MSNVENITRVYLLNVPLESDYRHTLYFDDKTKQEEYFKSRIVAKFSDFTYVKKENVLRIPSSDDNRLLTNYDSLLNLGVNYVMFQNKYFSNKWFYCFIKDLKYINDERTDIEIENDVMQTWCFDYEVKESFVEREHVDDDTVGLHTVPENLEMGEFICNDYANIDMGISYIVVGTTQIGNSKKQGALYGGVYSGVHYLAWTVSDYAQVNSFINGLDTAGYGEAIKCIFIAPRFLLGDSHSSGSEVKGGTSATGKTGFQIDKNNTKLDYYIPKNRKLLTFPFNYLLISNNNGGSAVYKYEYFGESYNDTCDFYMHGTICPGCSIKLVPQNYKNVPSNLEESLNAGKFPICNWANDAYTNWLTQNSVNIGVSLGSSALQIASGLAMLPTGGGTLAGGSMIASGIQGIAGTLGQVHEQSFTPPQTQGNLNCGDVLQAMGRNTFTAYQMSINGEFAERLDKYFSAFGYQVNMIKVPNKAHRKNFWYTKTIDCNLRGAIPQNDMQKIKENYNKGITFWRNPDFVENYLVDNSIVE